MTHINKRKDYYNDYWYNNKDRLLKIHQCEICGAKYSLSHKSRHNKSKYHKTFEFIKKIINTTH